MSVVSPRRRQRGLLLAITSRQRCARRRERRSDARGVLEALAGHARCRHGPDGAYLPDGYGKGGALKILLAVDSTKPSREAVKFVVDHTKELGGNPEVHLVNVQP